MFAGYTGYWIFQLDEPPVMDLESESIWIF